MSTRNREAGNAYERQIVNELKDRGYSDITTTRAESRNMDNKGVDIMGNIPFYVQCKLSINNPNYHKLLYSSLLPKDKPTVVFHGKCEKAKVNFIKKADYVIMTKDYFYNIINQNK